MHINVEIMRVRRWVRIAVRVRARGWTGLGCGSRPLGRFDFARYAAFLDSCLKVHQKDQGGKDQGYHFNGDGCHQPSSASIQIGMTPLTLCTQSTSVQTWIAWKTRCYQLWQNLSCSLMSNHELSYQRAFADVNGVQSFFFITKKDKNDAKC